MDELVESVTASLLTLDCVCKDDVSIAETRKIVSRIIDGDVKYISRIRVRLNTDEDLEAVKTTIFRAIGKSTSTEQLSAIEALQRFIPPVLVEWSEDAAV